LNQIKDTKLSCLNLFGEFARKTFLSYLSSTLKDKSCIKPCLDLIYALLKVVSKSKPCFNVVERLLRKEDFYLLKNFPEEEEKFKSYLENIGLVFEYMDKAMPMAMNGKPIFSSANFLSKEDSGKMFQFYNQYKEIREKCDNF
jgi:hypothetical protein